MDGLATQKDDVWRRAATEADKTALMSREQFVQLFKGLWASKHAKAPDAVTMQMWRIATHDLTEIQFLRAIMAYQTQHAREEQFPTPQLILELAGVKTSQQEDDAEAVSAWDDLLRAINRVGAYATPSFHHPKTASVVRHLGGWVAICDKEPGDLRKWTRQDFLKAWKLFPTPQEPARLTNLVEIENSRTGQTDEAARIGQLISGRVAKRITNQSESGHCPDRGNFSIESKVAHV